MHKYADLWIIPVIFFFFRISHRPRRSKCMQYLKGINKRKRAANIIGNKDIGMAKLNMRKESNF
jgi:hypothetical protein